MPGLITTGTANWADTKDFYPRGTKSDQQLAYYAAHLPMVEINASFFRRIAPDVYTRWAAETPEGFAFTVKAHLAICQPIADPARARDYLAAQHASVDPLRAAGKFLGFLVQFGPNVRPTPEAFTYLQQLREGLVDLPVALELRRPDWLLGDMREQTLRRLRDLHLALVISDEPRATEIGLPEPVTALTARAFAYYRFAGRDDLGDVKPADRRKQRAAHRYTTEAITELANLVTANHTPQTTSVAVFYNKAGRNRVDDAQYLYAELARRGLAVPPIEKRAGME